MATVQDFLLNLGGFADRLEAITTKLEADHKTALDAKDEEIAGLRDLLAKAPSQKAFESKIEEIKELTARAEKAETELAAVPAKVNAEAVRIVAAQGHEQVDVTANGEKPTEIQAALAAQKDPVKRTLLFRKHRDAIKANYSK